MGFAVDGNALAAWLDRIGYDGPVDASPATLTALHRAHLFAVPFENLDIHLGRRIVPDPGAFYRKIVQERRGGFCYELNGLFARMLEALGFRVTLLSASVLLESGAWGAEFGHMTLRVDLDEPWLADVGFGDSFLDPLPLRADGGGGGFRLSLNAGIWTIYRKKDSWREQYRFADMPRDLHEFGAMCNYHQTSAQSTFTKGRVATLATSEGRITLTGPAAGSAGAWRMIETRGQERRERLLQGEEEFLLLLRDRLGIYI